MPGSASDKGNRMNSWRTRLRRLLGRDPNMAPRICYSQDGEDLFLERLLEGTSSGFYIDVGAHHPVRFSNTYMFYLRGWRGINVDAQPGSMEPFRKLRPRDINLECGVGTATGVLPYYQFNEPALNTFERSEAEFKDKPPYRITGRVDIAVRRLDALLDEHLPAGQVIDFLTVDVEGKDLEVLESNNWDRYRPRLILAETLRTELLNLSECPSVRFLADKGYQPIGKTYNTTFFERIEP